MIAAMPISSHRRRAAPRPAACAVAAALLLALGGCGIFGGGDDSPGTPTIGNRRPILSRIATAVEPDAALAAIRVALPAARENADWAQAGGNAAKSSGHVSLAATPRQAWRAQIAGSSNRRRLAAAPVIGGGRLYAVDTEGVIHAFDAASGARVWTHTIDVARELEDAAFGGGVSFADGRVYAAIGTGDVVALDAATGDELWRVKPAGPLRGSPTIAFNSLYVMTQDNQIHALSTTDGSPIWQDAAASGTSGVFGVAAPAAGQGTVVAGYSTGELVAYRYENGRNLWSDALSRTSISTQVGTLTDVDADPIIDGGQVFALGQGGRMAAYELTTGQRIWELTLAGVSTPTVAGEWIFTLTDDSRLLAIARATGRIKWITQLPRWEDPEDRDGPIFWTGPVLANGRLWIASSQGEIRSVDVTTGEPTDFTQLNDPISLPPIVAGNTLYILDEGGRITAWR